MVPKIFRRFRFYKNCFCALDKTKPFVVVQKIKPNYFSAPVFSSFNFPWVSKTHSHSLAPATKNVKLKDDPPWRVAVVSLRQSLLQGDVGQKFGRTLVEETPQEWRGDVAQWPTLHLNVHILMIGEQWPDHADLGSRSVSRAMEGRVCVNILRYGSHVSDSDLCGTYVARIFVRHMWWPRGQLECSLFFVNRGV